mmetsp:Transcript_84467/g.217543  ORF Transcript_84467/g.217543 Transcript_84467/m.217543 type:complete len:510 (+) Transcript_84467:55-1584(+)
MLLTEVTRAPACAAHGEVCADLERHPLCCSSLSHCELPSDAEDTASEVDEAPPPSDTSSEWGCDWIQQATADEEMRASRQACSKRILSMFEETLGLAIDFTDFGHLLDALAAMIERQQHSALKHAVEAPMQARMEEAKAMRERCADMEKELAEVSKFVMLEFAGARSQEMAEGVGNILSETLAKAEFPELLQHLPSQVRHTCLLVLDEILKTLFASEPALKDSCSRREVEGYRVCLLSAELEAAEKEAEEKSKRLRQVEAELKEEACRARMLAEENTDLEEAVRLLHHTLNGLSDKVDVRLSEPEQTLGSVKDSSVDVRLSELDQTLGSVQDSSAASLTAACTANKDHITTVSPMAANVQNRCLNISPAWKPGAARQRSGSTELDGEQPACSKTEGLRPAVCRQRMEADGPWQGAPPCARDQEPTGASPLLKRLGVCSDRTMAGKGTHDALLCRSHAKRPSAFGPSPGSMSGPVVAAPCMWSSEQRTLSPTIRGMTQEAIKPSPRRRTV